MAAATHTVQTLEDLVELGIADVGNDWLTETQLNSFIGDRIVADAADIIFTRRVNTTANQWYTANTELGGNPFALLFANDTTPFAGTDDVTYVTSCRGNIHVTAGSHTASTITISAAIVDYAMVMADVYFWLSQHRSIQISQNIGDASISPLDTARILKQAAQDWLEIHGSSSRGAGTMIRRWR